MFRDKRLVATGCSYTDYYWSTWADIVGKYFENYIQVGFGGADNATIARSVIKHARPNDIVMIMWSSFDRWSFYDEQGFPMPKDENNHWRHKGSLALWDKEFFVKYYHPVERFQTTMDYIQLINLHKEKIGYKVYNFSAFPLFRAETGIGVDKRLVEIYNKTSNDIENNFLLSIPSLEEFKQTNYSFKLKGDSHPHPLCHWEYVEKFIAPQLDIVLDNTHKQQIQSEYRELLNNNFSKEEILKGIK